MEQLSKTFCNFAPENNRRKDYGNTGNKHSCADG